MKFRSYDKVKSALDGTANLFDVAGILDIDGVINTIKTLEFQELPINALAVLQGAFREINLLTGRYANLFANQGVQKFVQCGFDFSKPFRYFAEMGGVEICLVKEAEIYEPGTKKITADHMRMLKIVDDPAKVEVNCNGQTLYWVAKLHAPEITSEVRDLIWQATKSAIAEQISSGALKSFGIMPGESVEIWADRLYNRELENLTKGTVTTSRVPQKYADLAYAVNAEIGQEVAQRINKALVDYNQNQEHKLQAIHHPSAGCVEVLFDGINKFNAAKRIIQQMDQTAGHKIKNIATFGDSYPDVLMAQAGVELERNVTHFHLGSYENFVANFKEEGNLSSDSVLAFPQFDTMYQNNPNIASTVISGSVFWWLVENLQDQVKHARFTPWEATINRFVAFM